MEVSLRVRGSGLHPGAIRLRKLTKLFLAEPLPVVTAHQKWGRLVGMLRLALPPFFRRWLPRQHPPACLAAPAVGLADLTLDIAPGSAVCVVGGSRAGKSTLLRLLAGHLPPTRGRGLLAGRFAAHLPPCWGGWHARLTVRENIGLLARRKGLGRAWLRRNADALMAEAQLPPRSPVLVSQMSPDAFARISLGFVRRVDPDIVLVDAARFNSVPWHPAALGELLQGFKASGKTLVVVAPVEGLPQEFFTHGLWLEGGRLRAYGDSATVLADYRVETEAAEIAPPVKRESKELRRWHWVNSPHFAAYLFITGEKVERLIRQGCRVTLAEPPWVQGGGEKDPMTMPPWCPSMGPFVAERDDEEGEAIGAVL